MFQAAADGKIKIETENVDIENIEAAWNAEIQTGKRLVVRI